LALQATELREKDHNQAPMRGGNNQSTKPNSQSSKNQMKLGKGNADQLFDDSMMKTMENSHCFMLM